MKLETLITEFAVAAGMENPVAVEGVWKFSADGHVFGVVEAGRGRCAPRTVRGSVEDPARKARGGG